MLPIMIREVHGHDKKLRLKIPLILTPGIDEETKQLLVVEEPKISLHAFAYTRDELIHEINEQIIILWDEYVIVSADELASDALQLRETLIERIEEVENAQTKN